MNLNKKWRVSINMNYIKKKDKNIFLGINYEEVNHINHMSPRCMLKIDLQKADNSVEWIYLKQVMKDLCFTKKFVKWRIEYDCTINYSIMIN